MPPKGIKINTSYEANISGDTDIYTVSGIEFQKDIFNQLFKESKVETETEILEDAKVEELSKELDNVSE